MTFGSSSCLERIGIRAFSSLFSGGRLLACGIEEIAIPDSVRELCDRCFYGCLSLHFVTFGSSSALERIGRHWIRKTQVSEVIIPDTVRERIRRAAGGRERETHGKGRESIGKGKASRGKGKASRGNL